MRQRVNYVLITRRNSMPTAPRRRWLPFELNGLLVGVTFVTVEIAMLSG